ncbi:MAG: S41 family peptidase [Bryobacteraceae bacterium]|jgi:carboxyl-terminal processing protease
MPAALILACSLAGGLYVRPVSAAEAEPGGSQNVGRIALAYELVEENFATVPDPDQAIYRGMIPGMLRTLDPHSTFFDPKDYQALREEQTEHYSGVGMSVGVRGDQTVVSAPFPGSPAYRVGIRPGDAIVAVNGQSVGGLNTSEVVDLLKGPRNTQVTVTVEREGASGTNERLSFTLIREDITRKTVHDAFWLRPGIAYLHILSFGDYTGREVEQNLKRLGEDRIEGLVLDLRFNPGGLLNQAVEVAGHFLEKGQSVVSQRGRASRERVYTAEHSSQGRRYPIVVLVNHYSASAAEIVSGALQDHDRAWILGENTFGKGLVQTIFSLPGRTALALTTAHFYTPSGRLIQRDYSHESLYDYYFHEGRATSDSNDRRSTDGGRAVYGGNGIAPDEKFDSPRTDRLEFALERTGLFAFTRAYFAAHPAKLPEGWMPGNDTIEELHDYLLKHGYQFTEAEFTRDHDWIKRYLAREMYIWAFDVDESDRVFAMTDPEAGQAMDALAQAAALLEKGRVVVESRRPAPAAIGQR